MLNAMCFSSLLYPRRLPLGEELAIGFLLTQLLDLLQTHTWRDVETLFDWMLQGVDTVLKFFNFLLADLWLEDVFDKLAILVLLSPLVKLLLFLRLQLLLKMNIIFNDTLINPALERPRIKLIIITSQPLFLPSLVHF
jgi:hypothetical protein